MIVPSKRQLSRAIALARKDSKIDARLTDAAMQTVEFYKTPYLFWPAGACGNNNAHLAPVRHRGDLTFYVGYAEPCNPDLQFNYWTPRDRV